MGTTKTKAICFFQPNKRQMNTNFGTNRFIVAMI